MRKVPRAKMTGNIKWSFSSQLAIRIVREIEKENKQERRNSFCRIFIFSFLKSDPVHTPHPRCGEGRMGVGVSAFLQYGTRIPRLGPALAAIAIRQNGRCLLSRSSTARVRCPKNTAAIQKTLRPSKKCCGHPKNTTQPETWERPLTDQDPGRPAQADSGWDQNAQGGGWEVKQKANYHAKAHVVIRHLAGMPPARNGEHDRRQLVRVSSLGKLSGNR
jgi:hypothetical protein